MHCTKEKFFQITLINIWQARLYLNMLFHVFFTNHAPLCHQMWLAPWLHQTTYSHYFFYNSTSTDQDILEKIYLFPESHHHHVPIFLILSARNMHFLSVLKNTAHILFPSTFFPPDQIYPPTSECLASFLLRILHEDLHVYIFT